MKQPEYARAVLTAIAYYRLFRVGVDEDLSSITQPGPVVPEQILQQVEEFARSFYKNRRINPFIPSNDPFPAYATTKAGANGPSAMGLTSMKDVVSLEEDDLYQRIISLSSKTYENPEVLHKIMEDTLITARETLDINQELLTQTRLHLLAEGGGKTRVICIPDIWTQSCLKPIHNYLMSCLKKMPCDGTFGHSVLGSRVKKFTQRRGLFCFDLSAATDRFPLSIQVAALKPLLGEMVHE